MTMLMFRNDSKTGMVTTFAGMALIGLTLSAPAMAQDRSMDSDILAPNVEMIDPAPVNYPIAAPGGVDLYHWRTYERNTLSPGSATEKRKEIEEAQDMRLHRTPITEDPLMVDPAPWRYPEAAPDGLDLYHFKSYRRDILVEGSVREARMDLERERDKRLHMETKFTDDQAMADPAPLQYPIAAPGGADLYHWHSYEENRLSPGSATEKREMNERKRDKERKNESAK